MKRFARKAAHGAGTIMLVLAMAVCCVCMAAAPATAAPVVMVAGAAQTVCDTYVSTMLPDNHASELHLDVGGFSEWDSRRSLLKFDLSSIPTGSAITSAHLQLMMGWNGAMGPSTISCLPIAGAWAPAATWGTTFSNHSIMLGPGSTAIVPPGSGQLVSWDITSFAQWWLNGVLQNNGVAIVDSTEAATSPHAFLSSEYPSPGYLQPQLVVEYTPPSVSVEPVRAAYRPGDLVRLSVHVSSRLITNLKVRVEGRSAVDGPVTQAAFAFTLGRQPAPWVSLPVQGGFLSYLRTGAAASSPTVGTEPDVPSWSLTPSPDGLDATFAYRIKEGSGDVQDNRILVRDADWQTAWQDSERVYDVAPSSVATASATTTSSAGWFRERDDDGDGIADVPNDAESSGRGAVRLTWEAVPAASSYNVYLSDGAEFRCVGSTTSTLWSSAGSRLYPSDSAIDARSSAATESPFRPGQGFDLRDDPRPLYRKTTPDAEVLSPSYSFKVVAANSSGEAPLSEAATLTVSLEGRSVHLGDEPNPATVEAGDIFDDRAAVTLKDPALTLDSVDLSLPSNGPELTVSRHYSTSATGCTTFGPGWRFGFEQRIAPSGASKAVYLDDEGRSRLFVRSHGAWVSPSGDSDVLSGDARVGWVLTHKDHSSFEFDATGRLTASRDSNGNAVYYDWASEALTIRAPGDVWLLHERRAVVRFQKGRVVSVTLCTPSGDRVVNYGVETTSCTVISDPGTSAQRNTVYGYKAGRIAEVSVPDALGPTRTARWAISGVPGQCVSIANSTSQGTSAMRREVTWGPDGCATTTLAGGGVQTVIWDALGREIARSEPASAAQTVTRYDALGNVIGRTTPAGRDTSAVFDEHGNVVAELDEAGRTTSYRYVDDRCVEEHDPRGSETAREYDSRGNVLAERKTVDASGTSSVHESTYDIEGHLASERWRIDASTWARTSYAGYADCGEPTSVTRCGVVLAAGAAPVDLVERQELDSFGRVISQADANGAVVSRTSYDSAGRPVEVMDAAGTVKHLRYTPLGGVAETWRSNPATSTKVEWSCLQYNGAGQVVTETVRASDGATASTTVRTYDTAGRQVRTDSADVPGQGVTKYDAAGKISSVWAEGANTSSVSASARMAYDADGNVTSERLPGSSAASIELKYSAEGDVVSERDTDGRLTSYEYGGDGELASESVAGEAATATIQYRTDLDGRVTSETALADGTTTVRFYDLLGNESSSRLGRQDESTIIRNALGWELRRRDFDQVVTENEYDPDGHLIATRQDGQVTRSVFDSMGREVVRANPDGSTLERGFDEFSRLVRVREMVGGADVSRTITTYDPAGRIAETLDEVNGAVSAYSYGATGTVTESRSQPGGAAVTTLTDGTGLLRSAALTIAGAHVDWSAIATDSAGRIVDARSSATSATRTVTYDDAGRLVRNALGVYRFGSAGHKTGETLKLQLGSKSEKNQYSYDATGRLVEAVVGGTLTTYQYSPDSGALVKASRSGITTSFEYDARGRLATATAAGLRLVYSSDTAGARISAGSSSSSQQTRYSWSGDRLIALRGPFGAASHTYDASGARLRSVIVSGSVVTTVAYTYDGTSIASLSAATSAGQEWTIGYLYDATGQADSAVYRSSSTPAMAFTLARTDRGDVRELLDACGTAFASYTYDAYGAPTGLKTTGTSLVTASAARDIASRQPLRYAGYVWDSESGLYCVGERYYDPAVAAFISRDPDKSDGEESQYQYCAGEPVLHTDPSGRSKAPALRTGALSAGVYDQVREKIVFGALYVAGHARGYAPDNATQGSKGAPNGYTDCSGLVTWIMANAGVFPKSAITNWNSRSIYDHAATKSSNPTISAFDARKKTAWRIGDIVQSDPPINHVAIVVRDAPDPYIAESSPTYRGPAIHKLSKRKSPWKFQHAGRFFTRRSR